VINARKIQGGVDEHVTHNGTLCVAPKHCAHHASTRAQGHADAPRMSRVHAGAELRTRRAARCEHAAGPKRCAGAGELGQGRETSGRGHARRAGGANRAPGGVRRAPQAGAGRGGRDRARCAGRGWCAHIGAAANVPGRLGRAVPPQTRCQAAGRGGAELRRAGHDRAVHCAGEGGGRVGASRAGERSRPHRGCGRAGGRHGQGRASTLATGRAEAAALRGASAMAAMPKEKRGGRGRERGTGLTARGRGWRRPASRGGSVRRGEVEERGASYAGREDARCVGERMNRGRLSLRPTGGPH
jgi:hypothetical protein